MKRRYRIIALVMAMLTISGMLAACASTNDPEVTTEAQTQGVASTTANPELTEETTLYPPDDLEESYNFDTELVIYMWSECPWKSGC